MPMVAQFGSPGRENSENVSYARISGERARNLFGMVVVLPITDGFQNPNRMVQSSSRSSNFSYNCDSHTFDYLRTVSVGCVLQKSWRRQSQSLDLSNCKLKLKEELAAPAMAAQVAAERSLQLADSRAAGLPDQIEMLTRQLDETDRKGEQNGCCRVRHICWLCGALRVNAADMRGHNVRWILPDIFDGQFKNSLRSCDIFCCCRIGFVVARSRKLHFPVRKFASVYPCTLIVELPFVFSIKDCQVQA
ncbi:hypothetical protein NE237_028329 [Protea cynaroides]|uniref:Uncharacterized protein n=1 Tax=Protea cynaroides TaxID=273540 RepID=A0A9Q0JTY6_9MAGN|nr:hypothetical protein NE237_028329 [Protea cynaroides]